nr:hypothetical protein [Tanacetum cinerariifolium]
RGIFNSSHECGRKDKGKKVWNQRGFFEASCQAQADNANACHLKVFAVTPPAWKNHLDNQLDVELLELHDQCYARQAVDMEKVRDQECEELKAKCKAAMVDFDKNPAINVLREKIASLFREAKEHRANLDRICVADPHASSEALLSKKPRILQHHFCCSFSIQDKVSSSNSVKATMLVSSLRILYLQCEVLAIHCSRLCYLTRKGQSLLFKPGTATPCVMVFLKLVLIVGLSGVKLSLRQLPVWESATRRPQTLRGKAFEETKAEPNMPVCPNSYPSGLFADPTRSVTPFVRGIEEYPLPDGLKMPSRVGSYDEKRDLDNFLHLFEGAIRSILNYKDLKANFRSHFSQQKRFTKMHLTLHNIKQRKARVSEFSPLDLLSTYKGLTEKTYTWIEAREVAINGSLNNQRDNSERSRKSSWDNGKGQRSRDKFFPYRGPNHGLLSSLSKSPRDILTT